MDNHTVFESHPRESPFYEHTHARTHNKQKRYLLHSSLLRCPQLSGVRACVRAAADNDEDVAHSLACSFPVCTERASESWGAGSDVRQWRKKGGMLIARWFVAQQPKECRERALHQRITEKYFKTNFSSIKTFCKSCLWIGCYRLWYTQLLVIASFVTCTMYEKNSYFGRS